MDNLQVDLFDKSFDMVDRVLIDATNNWSTVRWRGHLMWQNLLDLNVISEHIFATHPEVIVETGTWYGGSALFFADMMQLAGREPSVISIDIAPRATPPCEGVTYLSGQSSVDPLVAAEVAVRVAGRRTFVILDSDHQAEHVHRELETYSRFIAAGDYLLVEDGNMYGTVAMPLHETPIGGIAQFLKDCDDFEVDAHKSHFQTTSHRCGWLRRRK
jgi:cephalosporin hydroxylase